MKVLRAEELAVLLGDEHDEFAVLGVAGEDIRDDVQLGVLSSLVLGAVTNLCVNASRPGERPFEWDVSERRSNARLPQRWQIHVLLDNGEGDLLETAHLSGEQLRSLPHAASLRVRAEHPRREPHDVATTLEDAGYDN